MLENMTLRLARIKDLPAIVDIYNSTIPGRTVTADTEFISVSQKLDWFYSHDSHKYPIWVVEHEGKICGWVSLQPFYGRPAYSSTAEISIYLREDFRGKGLGKWVLNKVIAECPKLYIETLLGFVFAHNEASLKLLTRCGFEKWGYLPGVAKLDGVKRDLVILGLRIPADR